MKYTHMFIGNTAPRFKAGRMWAHRHSPTPTHGSNLQSYFLHGAQPAVFIWSPQKQMPRWDEPGERFITTTPMRETEAGVG